MYPIQCICCLFGLAISSDYQSNQNQLLYLCFGGEVFPVRYEQSSYILTNSFIAFLSEFAESIADTVNM
jgi:hypothetical protein